MGDATSLSTEQLRAKLGAPADGLSAAEAQARLDELRAERQGMEAELTGAAGQREAALSVSYELRSRAAGLAVQRESAERLAARLGAELAEAEADAAHGGPSPQELEEAALLARAAGRGGRRPCRPWSPACWRRPARAPRGSGTSR